MNPHARARQALDRELEQSGCVLRNSKQFHLSAERCGVVREHPNDTGPADYVFFVETTD
jgi:type I restriction enzyme R subunit